MSPAVLSNVSFYKKSIVNVIFCVEINIFVINFFVLIPYFLKLAHMAQMEQLFLLEFLHEIQLLHFSHCGKSSKQFFRFSINQLSGQ